MFKKIAKWFAAAASIFGVATVEAASVVPAATTTQLTTDGTDTMTAIGSAILLVAVVAVLFKWAKAAIFG